MRKINIIQVDVNGYLRRPENSIIKSYCDHLVDLISWWNSYSNIKFKYRLVGFPKELFPHIENLNNLPDNRKFPLMADIARYYYLNKLGGIYLDTDLEVFDQEGLCELISLYQSNPNFVTLESEFYKGEWVESPCNWLMASSKNSPYITELFYKFLSVCQSGNSDLLKELWGGNIFVGVKSEYAKVPSRFFQGYTWNCDWHTPNIPDGAIYGAHHFGLGPNGEKISRPALGEFQRIRKG